MGVGGELTRIQILRNGVSFGAIVTKVSIFSA